MATVASKKLEYPAGVLAYDANTQTVKADPRQGKILFEIVSSKDSSGRKAIPMGQQRQQGGSEPLPL